MKNRLIHLLLLIFISTHLFGGQSKSPKYIFYMIGDGMGFSHAYTTDVFLRQVENDSLCFLRLPMLGAVQTYATDKFVTCSAAAGTAMATGEKTHTNTIGLSSDHSRKLKSIAYDAQEAGMKVGIITTMPINHATPAAFYAHQEARQMYSAIADEMIATGFDYFAGCDIYKSKDSAKYAEPHEAARMAGYTISTDRSVLSDRTQKKRMLLRPYLEGGDHPFVIDSADYDSFRLTDFVSYGIQQLDNKNGFFMMVEGGAIDIGGHSNDVGAIMCETKEFDDAVKLALEFYQKHPDETLIIVTADHETGGVSLGNNFHPYELNLPLLKNQKRSMSQFNRYIVKASKANASFSFDDALAMAETYMGIGGEYFELSDDELKILQYGFDLQFNHIAPNDLKYTRVHRFSEAAGYVLSQRAGIGFTTNAHSATLVPIFSIGCGSEQFSGMMQNADIAIKLRKFISTK